MICPSCHQDQSICRDSRQRGVIRERTYDCMLCGQRYFTQEVITEVGQRRRPRPRKRRHDEDS